MRREWAHRPAADGRRVTGTALLLSAVCGSGIVTATGGPASTQLFQHALAGTAATNLMFDLDPVAMPTTGRDGLGMVAGEAVATTATYTGVASASAPGFLAGQAVGTCAAVGLIAWLYDPTQAEARDVVVPHDDTADGAREPAVSRRSPP